MDRIAIIVNGSLESMDIKSDGSATAKSWEKAKARVDSLNNNGNRAKCLLFRNNPKVSAYYSAGDIRQLESIADGIYPAEA